jgi:tetratricopeptide (TPR) repeat protein
MRECAGKEENPLDHHPTHAELEGLVLGCLSKEQTRAVVGHLLRGCGECRVTLAPHLERLAGRAVAPPPPGESYDGALDRAFASVARLGWTPQPVQAGEDRTRGKILDLIASGGLEAILERPDCPRGLPLYEALLERSWALRHEDPDQMVQLARFAAMVAERLDPRSLGAQEVADLQCRAWIELGNAYRVADVLDQAESAMGRATERFLQGTGDELLWARLFTILGSLYAARRLFELAATSLNIVSEIYRQHGDEHLAGRALIKKGIFVGYQGDPEEAVRLIGRGLSMVDDHREPGLVSSTLQTQAWFLVDSGRYGEARRALWRLRQREADLGGRLNELKVRWLEGHIAEGLGELDRAERALTTVKQGFEEANLPYKAALAGLELGVVWFRQQRLEETERAILESADTFLSLGIGRELLASVLLLRKAAEMRCLNLVLLRETLDLLRQSERDPTARFQPLAEP